MTVTREQLVKKLAQKSGFWQKDIRDLFKCLDEVILEYFAEATENEDVSIQLVSGIKIGCSIIPERERKNPRTQQNITCKPCCKPKSKFSVDFRHVIQQNYEEKQNG